MPENTLTCNIPKGLSHDANIVTLEPASGFLAKNEIRSTDDLILYVDLISLVAENRILEPFEFVSVVAAVSICAQCNSLAALAIVIHNIHVVKTEAFGLDA